MPIQYTWFAEIGSTWRYHIAKGVDERSWGESIHASEMLKKGIQTNSQFDKIVDYYSQFLRTGDYGFGVYELHDGYELIVLPEQEGYHSFDYYGGCPDLIPTQKTYDDETINFYKELIREGNKPTMVIFHIIESHILFILDGHHKFLAYGQLQMRPRAVLITKLNSTDMTSEQAIKIAKKMNCDKENYFHWIKSEKKNKYFDRKLDLEKSYEYING